MEIKLTLLLYVYMLFIDQGNAHIYFTLCFCGDKKIKCECDANQAPLYSRTSGQYVGINHFLTEKM